MRLTPALERQRKVCLCEYKASLVYTVSYRSAKVYIVRLLMKERKEGRKGRKGRKRKERSEKEKKEEEKERREERGGRGKGWFWIFILSNILFEKASPATR